MGFSRRHVAALLLIFTAFLSHSAASAQRAGKPSLKIAGCPPPPQTGSGGRSNLKVTGPCAFEHTGEAVCDAEFDDLLVSLIRPGRNSTELMFFINVERYVGPRIYKPPIDMWVSLKDGSKMYRWSTNRYEATVGPASAYVSFKDVRLEPEEILTGCTGPQTNYQCDGREDNAAFMATSAIANGTVYCRVAPGARRPR